MHRPGDRIFILELRVNADQLDPAADPKLGIAAGGPGHRHESTGAAIAFAFGEAPRRAVAERAEPSEMHRHLGEFLAEQVGAGLAAAGPEAAAFGAGVDLF